MPVFWWTHSPIRLHSGHRWPMMVSGSPTLADPLGSPDLDLDADVVLSSADRSLSTQCCESEHRIPALALTGLVEQQEATA